jgi:hypothetical protein
MRRISLTLVLFCLLAPCSQAADLSFFIGGIKPGSIKYRDAKTMLDASPIFGARFATYFVPSFGMEHTLAFSSDYLFPGSLSGIKSTRGFVYNTNLIFNLPVKKVVPYITVGAGLIHQFGGSDLPVGTKFGFNYGGGLKFPHIAGPLGLRFDARGYSAGIITRNVNMLEMSGGILLSFDRK